MHMVVIRLNDTVSQSTCTFKGCDSGIDPATWFHFSSFIHFPFFFDIPILLYSSIICISSLHEKFMIFFFGHREIHDYFVRRCRRRPSKPWKFWSGMYNWMTSPWNPYRNMILDVFSITTSIFSESFSCVYLYIRLMLICNSILLSSKVWFVGSCGSVSMCMCALVCFLNWWPEPWLPSLEVKSLWTAYLPVDLQLFQY